MSNKQGMYKISLEESSFCYCFTSYAVYTYVEIVFIRRLEYSETPKNRHLKSGKCQKPDARKSGPVFQQFSVTLQPDP